MRTSTRKLSDLDLSSFLIKKGRKPSHIGIYQETGLAFIEFPDDARFTDDFTEYVSDSPERKLLNIRSQLFRQIRDLKRGGRP